MIKKCKQCGDDFKPFNSLQKFCSAKCMKLGKGYKQIRKVSEKRQAENEIYSQLRKVFLNKPENKYCPVMKQLKNVDVIATTVHHRKGRLGELLNNTKYWVALSMEGHEYVEKNPTWAKENGYSLDRLTN